MQNTLKCPVALIGFMGVGKSTIGKRLAKELQVDFIDTDMQVEQRVNKTISEIFADSGEDYFRELEHAVIDEIFLDAPRVVAIGGGAYCFEKNRKIIESVATSILLQAAPETIFERLKVDQTRPLLMHENKIAEIRNLLTLREASYQLARYCFRTDDGTAFDELVMKIKQTILGNQ